MLEYVTMLEALSIYQTQVEQDLAKMRDFVASLKPKELADFHTEQLINHLLGIPFSEEERDSEDEVTSRLEKLYSGEDIRFDTIGLDILHEQLSIVRPSAEDVCYDLGCGHGRLVLIAALTTPALWKGIDILPHRIAVAERARQKFQIENAQFICGNITDEDISEGHFSHFVHNSFVFRSPPIQ